MTGFSVVLTAEQVDDLVAANLKEFLESEEDRPLVCSKKDLKALRRVLKLFTVQGDD